ncbi:MAG: peptidoglycan-associated lipoprotein Pal [Alphaproteobacteria bacterium]|nr:peptidoglycan-associated lipoprotein Pal [Alphaproteobacteria bacterium]
MTKGIGACVALTMALLAGCAADENLQTQAGNVGEQASRRLRPAGQATDTDYWENVISDRVFFDYDKSELKPEARIILEKTVVWVKQYPTLAISFLVEGHCDERGTREFNLGLGERRAFAVKDYLVSLGLSEERVATISYGKEQPVVMGATEAAWAHNRRAVLRTR